MYVHITSITTALIPDWRTSSGTLWTHKSLSPDIAWNLDILVLCSNKTSIPQPTGATKERETLVSEGPSDGNINISVTEESELAALIASRKATGASFEPQKREEQSVGIMRKFDWYDRHDKRNMPENGTRSKNEKVGHPNALRET
jgi:hypothetical protein